MFIVGAQKCGTTSLAKQLFEQFVAPTLTMMAKEKWVHLTPIKVRTCLLPAGRDTSLLTVTPPPGALLTWVQ